MSHKIVKFARLLAFVLTFFPVVFQEICRFLHLKQKCLMASVCSEKLLFVFQPTRTSSESIYSRPGSSIPGSPGHTIYVSIPPNKQAVDPLLAHEIRPAEINHFYTEAKALTLVVK